MSDEGSKDKKDGAERPDKVSDGLDGLTIEDLLGMNEPDVLIDYVCIDCGCIDPVPDFVVAECAWGDEDGDDPEFECPKCNGTMVRKEKPSGE